MRVPLSWLKEYVEIDIDIKDLAHKLTMAGTEVGAIEIVGGWNEVFVGEVISIFPHPNADRLRLVCVGIGMEELTVVCGAPNVSQGQKIAFAKVGAVLTDPRTGHKEVLKSAKIRGVDSSGMVCSEEELAIGSDSSGILVLPEDAPVGTPLEDYIGDVVLDLEITPNRPDCMSVLGIAREISALTGKAIIEPNSNYVEEGESINKYVSVEIEDPQLCKRYTATLIEDVTVATSPKWIVERLIKAGQRPINNVVDITNYVMLEYGQPLHAFDFTTINGGKIVVRKATNNELFTTLDGTKRVLDPPMLVIADSQKSVALAGIMGGLNTEITKQTKTVFLESATFNPANTRKTAQALKLRSESSSRFEKGLQPNLALMALKRATYLIKEIAGGKVCEGIMDAYPITQEQSEVNLSTYRIKQILGVDVPLKQAKKILDSLGFTTRQQENELLVNPPYWRSDIEQSDDLVEEIARIIGYDNLPISKLSTPIPSQMPHGYREIREKIRDIVVSSGMQEVISYSLLGISDIEKSAPDLDPTKLVRLANPMSEQQEYLRINMRSSILNTLSYNLHQTRHGMKLFEIGSIYLSRPKELPLEKEVLIGVLAGQRWSDNWFDDSQRMDIFDAKGVLEALFDNLRLPVIYENDDDRLFAKGNCAKILHAGQILGTIGVVDNKILDEFEIDITPVSLFEIDIGVLANSLNKSTARYQPVSRYPGSYRDLALVLKNDIPSSTVKKLIEKNRLVSDATLFDVYDGKELDSGTKSLAYRVLFQSPERTLTGEEINQSLDQIIGNLKHHIGAILRS